jgi:hypothetical protein
MRGRLGAGHASRTAVSASDAHLSIGRSSLLATALMVLNGVDPDTAWRLLEQARGLAVPHTAEQREWPRRLLRETS